MKKIRAGASPAKSILATFISIIFAGTVLLMLPAATASGEWSDFMTAFFTATSATCVTGMSVVDALSHWTRFGHTVILLLIQVGGIGFIIFATVFASLLNRRITLRERLAASQAISVDSMSGIVGLAKKIILRVFLAETAGAMILAIRFIPSFGVGEGIFLSIFHSVSAFCNAGIDILSPGISAYATDPLVCLTLIALMVTGGLGFFVWEDLRIRKGSLSLHTKLALICTGLLLAGGAVMFAIFEYTNPGTIGGFSFSEKILAAFFQSATCRSAGFAMISQNDMSTLSKALTMGLMFIGGSPGSTAGGVKTVTVAVCFLAAICAMRGKREVFVFGRRLAQTTVYRCISVVFFGAMLVLCGWVIISIINPLPAQDILFECVAAFSTAGISSGVTPHLNDASKLILLVLMYLGRVGILTVSLGLMTDKNDSKINYPEGKIIIG